VTLIFYLGKALTLKWLLRAHVFRSRDPESPNGSSREAAGSVQRRAELPLEGATGEQP
jgi:hypothetical protein